mmetsp:Transcript_5481/g.13306  ORF Transcript_5481/g.13306 Transcript_5481/m.13306 type:complete len:285 (+) Transcript_5481:2515-3369(+)
MRLGNNGVLALQRVRQEEALCPREALLRRHADQPDAGGRSVCQGVQQRRLVLPPEDAPHPLLGQERDVQPHGCRQLQGQDLLHLLLPLLHPGNSRQVGGLPWQSAAARLFQRLQLRGLHLLGCGAAGGLPPRSSSFLQPPGGGCGRCRAGGRGSLGGQHGHRSHEPVRCGGVTPIATPDSPARPTSLRAVLRGRQHLALVLPVGVRVVHGEGFLRGGWLGTRTSPHALPRQWTGGTTALPPLPPTPPTEGATVAPPVLLQLEEQRCGSQATGSWSDKLGPSALV